MTEDQKVKLISLFSGIGMQEIAARRVYGDSLSIEAFCEVDPAASDCYSLLHGDDIPNLGDITTARINASQKDGSVDIVTASFPCQPFSTMGRRAGFEDDERGCMLFVTLNVIRKIRPRVVIFENVPSVVKFGAEEVITKALGRLYDCSFALLNSKDYGVPQNRTRWFGVCIRKDSTTSGGFEWPAPVPLTLCVADIIEEGYGRRDSLPCMKPLLEIAKRRLKLAKERGTLITSKSDKLVKHVDAIKEKIPIGGSGFARSRIYGIYGIAPTLLCSNTPCFAEVEGELTPLETWRLMDIEDDYFVKAVSNEDYGKRFLVKCAGNGIAVGVLEAIMRNLPLAQRG